MALTREQILAADDLPQVEVPVREWGAGATVWVRSMQGVERDAWEASLIGPDGERNMDNVRARLVALTAIDAAGNRLFNDDDAHALGKKSAAALDRLFGASMKLNALNRQEVAALAGE